MAEEEPPAAAMGEEAAAPPAEPPFTITVTVKSASALVAAAAEGEEPPAPPPPSKASFTFAGEAEPVECDAVEADASGAYTYNLTHAFERAPGAALIQQLLTTPLAVTIFSGDVALATASVDLAPFAAGALEVASAAVPLTAVPVAEGAEPSPLLPTATIAVTVTPSAPLMTSAEAAASCVLTLTVSSVAPAPESLTKASAAAEAPFLFTAGLPLTGIAPALITGGALVGDVVWNKPSAKFFLPGATVAALKNAIKGRGSTVPLEIARYVKPGLALHDPAFAAYRAVCALCLDDLLNPGAVTAAGTALLAAPFGGAPNSCLPAAPANPEGSKPIEEEPPADGSSAWASAAASPPTVTFAVALSKPLLPPFKPPAPAEMSVADLLPPREPIAPLHAPNTATEAFRAQVLSAAGTLSKEYAAMFTGEPLEEGGKVLRRKSLVFELNRSGKYHAMKERLKEAAQAIIKERFFAGGEGVQGKYNELYVHLVEEMHGALNALGAPGTSKASDAENGDAVDHDKLAKYKALADEYEVNREDAIADKWHQERLLLTRHIPEVWCDYGAFLSRRGGFGKAEEAYKEALGCDAAWVPALTALCALMLHDEEYGRAEVYGQAVTSGAAPADPVAWSLLAATYSALERETDATNCNYEARRLQAEAGAGEETHVSTALLLLDMHMPAEACALLEQESGGEKSLARQLCLGRASLLEGVTSTAYGHLMDALSIDATDPRAFELLGDLHASEGRVAEAEEAYTHAMALGSSAAPGSLKLHLNLGATLLVAGKHADARGVFMAACGVCPCASTWLGAGVTMLRAGDLEGAEAALAEANILDHTNAKVWGYLCLVALLHGARAAEAEQALGMAFKVNITDAGLLGEVGELFQAAGKWKHAEGALRRAVKHGAGIPARLALGKVMSEQNDADAAKVEYKLAEAEAKEGGATTDAGVMAAVLGALAGVHAELGEEAEAAACREQLAAIAGGAGA